MRLKWDEINSRARLFANDHKNDAIEEKDSKYWLAAFFNVFGVDIMDFKSKSNKQEEREADNEWRIALPNGNIGKMDFLWRGKIGIEMKTVGKSLDNAMDQLSIYVAALPNEDAPEILMASDMQTIRVFHRKSNVKEEFAISDLENFTEHFSVIAGYEDIEVFTSNEDKVSVESMDILGEMYKELAGKNYTGHPLELFLLRIVFCAFCEDTNLFDARKFINYVHPQNKDGLNFTFRLLQLFKWLNLPEKERPLYQETYSKDTIDFPYVNGGLFKDDLDRIPPMSKGIQDMVIDLCKMDWQYVSPSIFGSMFQSIGDKKKRNALGEHYTSEENILKVIKPLFLDALNDEFEKSQYDKNKLSQFHDKLASLNFLDPACGCGNFLIVAYHELRILEMKVVNKITEYQDRKPDASDFKVKLSQFHGIEINGFPCEIARAGMWMTEHLMNLDAQRKLSATNLKTIFPLTDSVDIINGNALRIDWLSAINEGKIDFIMGNPPFLGYSNQSKEQKEDMLTIFAGNKKAGKMDYVCAWYQKASQIMHATPRIKSAFVSTNSITQGEQVAPLWKPLFENGVHIDFAWKTFKWSNDAKGQAAVHCVIVGFSCGDDDGDKFIYEGDWKKTTVRNINGYLVDAPNICIESRKKPLIDDIPLMVAGNRPCDGGNLIIEEKDYDDFIAKEPKAEKYIKRLIGSKEYINGKKRYCLWLVGVEPKELKQVPLVLDRTQKVREERLKSSKEGTRKSAETPSLFQEIRQPDKSYVIIPVVSSEKREYIPMGFLGSDIIPTDTCLIIPEGSLYHFGILTSSVHMAWMRAVCGRLEMRYSYSASIVYNNFPWPKNVNDEQKKKIEDLAQVILDARDAHHDSTLADLYDPLTMPQDLRDAHNKLDREVLKLYGFEKNKKAGRESDLTEPQIVSKLMEWYQNLVAEQDKK